MKDMAETVKTVTPGKIHLIGEHAVVYGEPAIIAAINLNTLDWPPRESPHDSQHNSPHNRRRRQLEPKHPGIAVAMKSTVAVDGFECACTLQIQPGVEFIRHPNAAVNLNKLV